jgi:hypothetical protein
MPLHLGHLSANTNDAAAMTTGRKNTQAAEGSADKTIASTETLKHRIMTTIDFRLILNFKSPTETLRKNEGRCQDARRDQVPGALSGRLSYFCITDTWPRRFEFRVPSDSKLKTQNTQLAGQRIPSSVRPSGEIFSGVHAGSQTT